VTKPTINVGSAVGGFVLGVMVLGAILAPVLTPHEADVRFDRLLNAPPTAIHIVDSNGRLRAPFVHPWIRINQLEQQYEPDQSSEVPLIWFAGRRLVQSSDDASAPLLLLGSDSFGRDVFSRLLYGARVSLGLSMTAAVLAMGIGAVFGAVAGYVGGATDAILMRMTEFVIVLPAMYVVLALRAVMPLVLTSRDVFLMLLAIFSVLGAPGIARGVRAIVRSERHLDYAAAASSLGASHVRLLVRHLLPSARGFLSTQATLLIPAFIIAEATLSFVGLGFPDAVPSWGTMLHEASNLRALADFPWLLSPAAAMFLAVFGLNVMVQRGPISAFGSTTLQSIRA
jgi:peptide/nickel transport system permease protein